jgi:Fic family protein
MNWKLEYLEQSFLIGSTLVEGSTLTEEEAEQVLAGKTLQGHPVSEIRELLNYRSAIQWLIVQFSCSPFLSKDLILGFHLKLFHGFKGRNGVWKAYKNYTLLSNGSRHNYSDPSVVETEMIKWVDLFNSESKTAAAPNAADLYYAFEEIHPFEDGNGRIGRILIGYWLHWKFQLSWTFRLADKIEHLKSLEAANNGDIKTLVQFFEKRIQPEKDK